MYTYDIYIYIYLFIYVYRYRYRCMNIVAYTYRLGVNLSMDHLAPHTCTYKYILHIHTLLYRSTMKPTQTFFKHVISVVYLNELVYLNFFPWDSKGVSYRTYFLPPRGRNSVIFSWSSRCLGPMCRSSKAWTRDDGLSTGCKH